MKEFIEKLIGRLEELGWVFADYYPDGTEIHKARKKSVAYDDVISTVNQLAEEYKPNTNDAWKIVYDKVCNLEKEYANDGNIESVNDCVKLENLLQYFKEELQAEECKGGWIPCSVVDHPEHCNDCEVTIKDVYGYSRDIAYYTDMWRRLSDEIPVLVVAWKEPSAPYKGNE